MKANLYFLAGLVGIILSSCATDVIFDDKINVKNDSHFLKVEVTDKFAAAATRADYSGFPATTFEEDDAIGMYVFNGTTYVASNVRYVKQSDGSWLPDEDVPYCDGYTYYAYFPYRSTVYTPSTSGTVDAVDTKFADFITDGNNYFWQADQSTKAGFTYSNLMIAKGTVTDVGEDEATVKFTMAHKRGLAIIGDALNQWYYTDAVGTKYRATPIFDGTNVPYDESGTLYYLVKPNANTSAFGWTLNLPAGEYKSCPIKMTGTPTYQYSVSSNQGSTWGSYNGTKPSWLTITTNETVGQPTEFMVTTTNSTSTNVNLGTVNIRDVPGDATLKTASPVSGIDLSMVDNAGEVRATRTTANCYLVHAPGTYKIPLVYGNAIKNGDETSTAAFYTTKTSNTLRRLVNHANAGITTPWIKSQIGSCPDGAQLVWEDVLGMISSVGIDDTDNGYLTFTVDADNIAEGNAVIAATLNGTIVWSWHVWVTTQTLSNLTTIATGKHTYQVAPVYVGQVDGSITAGVTIYAGDLCKVRATANGVTMEFLVRAKNYTSGGTVRYYPSPYYQWGRKDAMYPSTGGFNSAGTLISTYSGTTLVTATDATPGATIQHPNYWYYNSSNYGPYGTNSTYAGKYNYWDINNTATNNVATATVKTVYDPCPPGFCVPTGNLYYFMGNTSSRSDADWNSTTKVKTWVTSTYSANTSGPDLVFPVAGYRDYSGGSLFFVASVGYCWSSTPYNAKYGRRLYFNSDGWYWSDERRACGYSVRPVVEE